MGHAVYSISDPRADIFKRFVKQLAREKHHEKEYALYEKVEHMAPEIIGEKRRMYKGVNANVDFYSGLVYSMLDLPPALYTPIFAAECTQAGRTQECRQDHTSGIQGSRASSRIHKS